MEDAVWIVILSVLFALTALFFSITVYLCCTDRKNLAAKEGAATPRNSTKKATLVTESKEIPQEYDYVTPPSVPPAHGSPYPMQSYQSYESYVQPPEEELPNPYPYADFELPVLFENNHATRRGRAYDAPDTGVADFPFQTTSGRGNLRLLQKHSIEARPELVGGLIERPGSEHIASGMMFDSDHIDITQNPHSGVGSYLNHPGAPTPPRKYRKRNIMLPPLFSGTADEERELPLVMPDGPVLPQNLKAVTRPRVTPVTLRGVLSPRPGVSMTAPQISELRPLHNDDGKSEPWQRPKAKMVSIPPFNVSRADDDEEADLHMIELIIEQSADTNRTEGKEYNLLPPLNTT